MTNPNAHSMRHAESFAAQFDSMTGMTRWLVWLAVMCAITAVFIIGFLYDRENKHGIVEYGLYFLMGGVGVSLMVKCFIDVKFLDREMRLTSSQVQVLESVDDFETFFAQAERSVFRSHIENLHTISLTEREFNQDNLIQILHERLMSGNRVVDLFGSILVTLGLIGTMVGLVQMMGSLSTVIDEKGASNLLDNLAGEGGPFGGLETAFNTTLLGAVLGGVMLRVLGNVVDSNTVRYTAHLAELTEVHVLPYMRKQARARHAREPEAD